MLHWTVKSSERQASKGGNEGRLNQWHSHVMDKCLTPAGATRCVRVKVLFKKGDRNWEIEKKDI